MAGSSADQTPLDAAWLGQVPYEDAYWLQQSLLEKRRAGVRWDTLLLLEHPHVFTLGRRGAGDELLASEAELEKIGARVVKTDRGGQTTYHGPGQLVGYPIVDLKPARMGPIQYVRMLEQVLIAVLTRCDVEGHRIEGRTGVWTHGSLRPDLAPPLVGLEAKIGAIGVRISRGITMHGFALNVSTDLSYFRHIVPCGMPDITVTSIASVLPEAKPVEEMAWIAAEELAIALGRKLRRIKPEALEA